MKRIIKTALVLGVGAAAGTGQSVVNLEQAGEVTRYNIHVDGVEFRSVEVNGETFQRATLQGVAGFEAVLFEEGAPEIPVLRFYVDGASDFAVRSSAPEAVAPPHEVSMPVVPVMASVPKVPGARRQADPLETAYKSNEYRPSGDHEIVRVGTVRGIPRYLVSLYPLQHNAATGTWTLRREFVVEARGIAEPKNTTILERPTIGLVVGETFEGTQALHDLIALKERQGFRIRQLPTRRATVTPDSVRAWLRAQLSDRSADLRYALIVGDHGDVPGKEAQHISGATDHYFRSIDTDDYDADIGTPDIGVGRLAVATPEELAIIVAKMIRYEQRKSAGVLGKLSWIASDDPSFWEIAEGSFNYAIDQYTRDQGYTGTYPDASNAAGGDKLYAITHHAETDEVLAAMAEGRALINYGGHGGVDYWVAPYVSPEHVRALTIDALPVVISNACITGRFIEDSFGEVWLRHDKGAIMFWGSMDSTYWDEDDILQRELYDLWFRDNVLEIARFTDGSLAEVWRHYGGEAKSKYYWETYVTFGDPSMNIRLR